MYCTKCGKPNAATNKYCGECGAKLAQPKPTPAAAPQTEQEEILEQAVDHQKVGDLLFEAFQHYESGRLGAALQSCREAIKLNPSGTSAYSLLSLIHEKMGDLESAISETERVLSLNPNSAADRERLEQLKRKMHIEPEPPTVLDWLRDRYRQIPQKALIAGALVFLAIVVLALAVRREPQPAATLAEQPSQATATTPQAPAQAPPQYPYAQSPPVAQPAPEAGYPYVQPSPPAAPARGEVSTEAAVPRAGGAKPVGTASATQPLPEISVEPRATTAQPPPATRPPAPQPQPQPRIEIKTGTRRPQPSSEPGPSRSGSSTLIEQAQAEQIAGNYDEAIRLYQQALNGAANPAAIHQQIGICNQRLGRNEQAAASYKAAIEIYKKQLSDGKNVDEARRGLAAAEAGLKVVQGGG